jgi:hypothetical protein
MEFVIILVLLSLLAVCAQRWGIDSTDGVASPEWQRRRQWRDGAGW